MLIEAATLDDPINAAPLAPAAIRQSGAYAVVTNAAGQVLLTEVRQGRFYLPGGRIEQGETPEQALAREIEEECGWSADILSPLGWSDQFILGGSVLLEASHWRARLVQRLDRAPEHRLAWVAPVSALARLHRDCDRYALRSLLS
jgi:8-oxo-dGTP pyrophosphatase MutT (NUDIX family)